MIYHEDHSYALAYNFVLFLRKLNISRSDIFGSRGYIHDALADGNPGVTS